MEYRSNPAAISIFSTKVSELLQFGDLVTAISKQKLVGQVKGKVRTEK